MSSKRNLPLHQPLATLAIGLVAAALLATPATAVSRNCTRAERSSADKALTLSEAEKRQALDRNLPWGIPESSIEPSQEELLIQDEYIIDYDDQLRVPIWTAHELNSKRLQKLDRINCFRADPRLASDVGSSPSDYKEPIFDQGHMTPNGDMALDNNAIINSFVMTNMTPQHCHFNRGIWEVLEMLTRRVWAPQHGTLYVITGSIFDANDDGVRDDIAVISRMHSDNGKARVAVPTALYKILAYKSVEGSVATLTIALPNDDTAVSENRAHDYLARHVEPISYVEARTGLRFFPKLSNPVREATQSTFWDAEHASFKGLDSSCPAS
jgi:endonuclease G